MYSILLTGGMGFIGSHTATILVNAGHKVVILDNLSNSSIEVLEKIQQIVGQKIHFVKGDVLDTKILEKTLNDYQIDSVIHFAGLKAVGESILNPIDYFENNVCGSISLLKAMRLSGVKNIVFSSSATVYGEPEYLPFNEEHPLNAVNPYGRSKIHIEEILKDVCTSEPDFSAVCLRYFNPVGAHESGLIGENPNEVPNNLMPFITQVALGKLKKLNIYGHDYPTNDGTGIRDYIHVMDLGYGHMKGLDFLKKNTGWHAFNLGTGIGVSVLEILNTFKYENQIDIPFKFSKRRPGDIAESYSDSSKANKILNWFAEKDLNAMCRDAWKFQKNLKN